jgi:hypothetical protein
LKKVLLNVKQTSQDIVEDSTRMLASSNQLSEQEEIIKNKETEKPLLITEDEMDNEFKEF